MKTYQLLIIALLVISTSCVKNKKGVHQTTQTATEEKAFVVKEVIQTSSYTYLKVDENAMERWVAISKTNAQVGEKYYYDSALQMNNFHSKELNRNFEIIYFINQASTLPLEMQKKMGAMPANHSGKAKTEASSSISMQKNDGEMTVAQVFKNSEEYANKQIEIRGIVVKVNKQVMGKNWIHIQDGTKHNGSFDLTITSQDLPKVNDEVTFKGTIILNKDFGAGYFYDLIMEEAQLLKQKEVSAQI